MDFTAWANLLNFSKEEFACKCGVASCEAVPMSYIFMQQLQKLRTLLKVPIKVTSGFRCRDYEKKIGGSGNNHPTGKAVDIQLTPEHLSLAVDLARSLNFTGVGINAKGPYDKRFLHLDMTHKKFTVWSY